mmetsp:Transcript_10428/g.26270  ORF Transcript_10428/g.26270 Transcript_10428/m.26270 type:complete len:234 (-) Transcript_10428:843-1544(-)
MFSRSQKLSAFCQSNLHRVLCGKAHFYPLALNVHRGIVSDKERRLLRQDFPNPPSDRLDRWSISAIFGENPFQELFQFGRIPPPRRHFARRPRGYLSQHLVVAGIDNQQLSRRTRKLGFSGRCPKEYRKQCAPQHPGINLAVIQHRFVIIYLVAVNVPEGGGCASAARRGRTEFSRKEFRRPIRNCCVLGGLVGNLQDVSPGCQGSTQRPSAPIIHQHDPRSSASCFDRSCWM